MFEYLATDDEFRPILRSKCIQVLKSDAFEFLVPAQLPFRLFKQRLLYIDAACIQTEAYQASQQLAFTTADLEGPASLCGDDQTLKCLEKIL